MIRYPLILIVGGVVLALVAVFVPVAAVKIVFGVWALLCLGLGVQYLRVVLKEGDSSV